MSSAGSDERRLAHLTEWFRRRPNSLEFWELFVTDERLLWCFVGETFSSALLRADVGERDRARLEDRSLEEIAAYDERNFTIPVSALERLRLVRGTRFRRARVEIEWTEDGDPTSMTLYNTTAGADQRELFERLAAEPALADVSIGIDSSSSMFRRS